MATEGAVFGQLVFLSGALTQMHTGSGTDLKVSIPKEK